MLFAGIGIVVLIPLFWWILVSNTFKKLGVKVEESSSGIDVALTKRYDTLHKLLEITKAYTKHEMDTFTQIVKLRKDMTVNEKSTLNTQLDQAQEKINVLAENYPELRSSDNYKALQMAAVDVEEHLQAARRLYNANVSLFNQKLVTFPDSIVANRMKLMAKDFFVADEGKTSDVQMKFDTL